MKATQFDYDDQMCLFSLNERKNVPKIKVFVLGTYLLCQMTFRTEIWNALVLLTKASSNQE